MKMRRISLKACWLFLVSAFVCNGFAEEAIKMVPFHKVKMHDTFWQPRIETLAKNTLPHSMQNTEVASKRLKDAADYAAGRTKNKTFKHPFISSDLFKVMEGAALMLRSQPNPEVESQLDKIIENIALAQREDGYLYVDHIINSPGGAAGKTPYGYVFHSHELYNVGHLYEAAVAYAQATGKKSLLKIAEKSARHVNKVFFVGDPNYNGGKPIRQAPGHQEIEIGLVKLYNYTGNKLYLNLAKKFLDVRGVTFIPTGHHTMSAEYAQQHKPVAQQRKAVGHSVRATYQYAAMAEIDSLLGTEEYTEALDSIWHDIVDKKMHITGGLGAIAGIEGFGPEYDLPNKKTYLETCAAIGNLFFNIRMFLKYRDAKYIDTAEVALLNNSLSGVSLDGKTFFYPNPLEADFDHKPRSSWFGCACCPSNIARVVPQVPGYMYAANSKRIYCALYGSSSTSLKMEKGTVNLTQDGNYPYNGDITITVNPEKEMKFDLALRIPGWAQKQLVPGALYSFLDKAPEWTLFINGKKVQTEVEKGFVVINRLWKAGDKVELNLPMPVRATTCIDKVEANRNRVSFSRGPLVYCAEGIDNDGAVQRFLLKEDAAKNADVKTIEEGMLSLMPGISLPAQELVKGEFKPAYIKLIPYFAWSNRDRSSMITWMPTTKENVKPDMFAKENLKFAKVSATHTCQTDTVMAVSLRNTPQSSKDTSIPRWTSWPQKNRRQTIDVDLGKVKIVRSIGPYWYDDKQGVHVPKAWHVEAKVNNKWEKITPYNTDRYSCLPDIYNTIQPDKKIEARFLRIVMEPQQDLCVGILSVNIDAE